MRNLHGYKFYEDENTFLILINVSYLLNHFSSKDLKFLKNKNYHIILTHGVTGELLNFIYLKNFYGLDKNRFTILSNSIELSLELSKQGINYITISESIFINDDLYYIETTPRIYNSIFSGRPVKIKGVLDQNYKFNSNIFENYIHPISGEMLYNDSNIYKLYNQCQSGIVPSLSEGSCRTINELLLCGIPIVDIKLPPFLEENINLDDVYSVVLPNTLGGRELYLNYNNSIISERTPESIDQSIQSIIKRDLCPHSIRKDFLSKLNSERLKFLLFLKNIYSKLKIEPELDTFINTPYSNSSINSKEWIKVKNHFNSLYL